MKMKNVAVACALMAGMTLTATSSYAAKSVDPTNGKIQFSGTLVNSACGLAPESSPVQVNFGEIPTSQLKITSAQEPDTRRSSCRDAIPPWLKLPP